MNRQAPTLLVALVLAGCGRAQTRDAIATDTGTTTAPDTGRTERTPAVTNAPKTIDAVLAAHTDSLLAVPGVLGTAVGRCGGAPCIRVLVSRVTDEVRRRVPRELGGFPVHVDVTGPIVPR